MLDIRTLLLGHPEDRYEPHAGLRAAEIAVFPLLSSASQSRMGSGSRDLNCTHPALVP